MKFSILIPLYNVEKYIRECLDSCIKQTFEDFEIIIINDGSTDNGPKICAEYNDSRIKIFHKENAGLLMARRDAIKQASGEYVIFLDSDDKLRSDCLEYVNNILESSKDPYDVVLYNLYKWDMTSGETVARKPVFTDGMVFSQENKKTLLERFLLSEELNNLVIKAVKREMVQADDTPYDKMGDSSYGEDKLQSFYIFSKAESIYYSSEPLYYYRNNPNSITQIKAAPEKIAKQISKHIELLANKYVSAWGLNTNNNVEKISVNRLLFLRTLFVKCFNSCENRKQRLDCLNYSWFDLILEENIHHLNSKLLGIVKRVELKAIFRKRYFVLNMLRLVRKAKQILKK